MTRPTTRHKRVPTSPPPRRETRQRVRSPTPPPPPKRTRKRNQVNIDNDETSTSNRDTNNTSSANHNNDEDFTLPNPVSKHAKNLGMSEDFVSCFPSITLENFADQGDKWTLVELRKELADQKRGRTRHKNQSPSEISKMVDILRIRYEKQMLMAALMGGISESMVWSLVNKGPKKKKLNCWQRFLSFSYEALSLDVPHRDDTEGWNVRNSKLSDMWDSKTEDEQAVFKDPLFFALAKLPDLSNQTDPTVEDEDQHNEQEDLVSQVSPPQVYQLSEEEENQYRPIFDRLVDVDKLHVNHGKPEATESAAKLQVKSLASFRKAHHDFATVCQRFHIHYHLTALSCDLVDGWLQVYSTNKSFAEWADNNLKLTSKFKLYVHGKQVAAEIEAKAPQPVDARRGELTRQLNRLLTEQLPDKKVFPKTGDPNEVIENKRWPIRLVLTRPESSLLPEELALGFRDCDDTQKRKWLNDIEKGFFYIEKIPPEEVVPRPRKRQSKSKKNTATATTIPNSDSLGSTNNQTTSDQTRNDRGIHSQSESIQNTQSQNQLSSIGNTQSRKSTTSAASLNNKRSKKSAKRANDGDSDDESQSDQTDRTASGSEEDS